MSKYGVISGSYFPVFGLNTAIYSVTVRIQSKYRKMWTRDNSVFGHFSRSVILKKVFWFVDTRLHLSTLVHTLTDLGPEILWFLLKKRVFYETIFIFSETTETRIRRCFWLYSRSATSGLGGWGFSVPVFEN